MSQTIQSIQSIGLVPVVKLNHVEDALPLAKALVDGGLPCAEVTFRTDAAAEGIRLMTQAYPEMVVGAGTVLTPAQVDEAVAAGAQFVVSPGFNPEVVDYCLANDVLVMPGINSPSGVEQCLARGITNVKFFPAENSGGLPFIKALAGPYAGVRFMPTGGISPDNLASYTTCPHILACGGTWMVKESLVDGGNFHEVERLCREAVQRMLGLRLERVQLAAEEPSADNVYVIEPTALPGLLAGGAGSEIRYTTIDLPRTAAYLSRKGIAFDREVVCNVGGVLRLAEPMGGFDVSIWPR